MVCFTSDHDASVLVPEPRAGPHRDRGLGRPHRAAGPASRGRAGLLLREPRPGDRGHAAPPARADLRLPVRTGPHPVPAERSPPARRPHRPAPGRRHPRGGAGRRLPDGAAGRALDAPTCRTPRAGRSRSTSRPHRDVPDLAALDRRGARRARRGLPASCCAASTATTPSVAGQPVRLPYIAAWHQAPGARGPRRLAPAPAGDVGAAGAGQAEVPRRLGVRRRRVGQRRPAGADRRAPARGRAA